jgi:diadenosine tetraphosphate (Ap4A) HIT family hydrolase
VRNRDGTCTWHGPHGRSEDREHVMRLLSVVQDIGRAFESRDGEAAVLTNLGRYQDTKHLHVHIHSGGRLDPAPGGVGTA